jgi:predicted negative regulator of RcsB-dependent stress response
MRWQMKPEKLLILNQPWYNIVDEINSDLLILNHLYNYINTAFKENKISDEILALSINFLEHNNIIFYANANYGHYQEVCEYLFNYYFIAKHKQNNFLFYKFCLTAVYSDYFSNKPDLKAQYAKAILKSIAYFSNQAEELEIDINTRYLFLGYIHLSQFYLFQGDLNQNKKYLDKAKSILRTIKNKNLILFFQYHYCWFFYEEGHSYDSALFEINKLLDLEKDINKPITLHAMNVKASILYKLENYRESYDLAKKVSDKALKIFSTQNVDVYAETSITMARVLLQQGHQEKARVKTISAIQKLEQLFRGNNIDPSQAVANELLGDIYLSYKDKVQAEIKYYFAQEIYEKIYGQHVQDITNYRLLCEKRKKLFQGNNNNYC